jgi:hypothetical protein
MIVVLVASVLWVLLCLLVGFSVGLLAAAPLRRGPDQARTVSVRPPTPGPGIYDRPPPEIIANTGSDDASL